jgi:uncharacterized protein (DUF1499 family)
VSLFSFSGKRPANLGVAGGCLPPCPASPNCVCSNAHDHAHRVDPFALTAPAPEAWEAVCTAVQALAGARIVKQTADYVHAECHSALFGFVDDLELHLRTDQGAIAVRSAARLGYSDFGVNRRRVERLRSLLADKGVVRA